MMKFEDLLMMQQPSEDQKQKRLHLQEEVEKLQQELDEELQIKTVLQCALQGPVYSCSCLPSSLPSQVQILLTELAIVEEEINCLERKVDELKLNLYWEKQQNNGFGMLQPKEMQQHQDVGLSQRQLKHLLPKEWDLLQAKDLQPPWGPWPLKQFLPRRGNRKEAKDHCELPSRSPNRDERRKKRILRRRRASVGSSSDIPSILPPLPNEDVADIPRIPRYRNQVDRDIDAHQKPNKVSEELIKCLMDIFLILNQGSMESSGSPIVSKNALSCMNSKSFMPKASLTRSAHVFTFEKTSNIDPYGILLDTDATNKDVGAYKNFIQITRSSIDKGNSSDCLAETGRLRVLVQKLSRMDLTHLTYKQKLAFWINVHNACIMHAFLQHGLPSTEEEALSLLNKAAIKVGGVMLNAFAIEHFILRHPLDSNHLATDEKEMLLRNTYGLGYPEPNVTFALCRGSWSSPALRIYTPEEVVNELERAKVEYIEASVGVTSKKKIMVPKLMEWHVTDFAEDMESLVEWIYSQLPQSCSLKRLIMDCLNNGDSKSPLAKMIEVQPYGFQFRYILPL